MASEDNFRDNILGHSADVPEGTPEVSGVDFNHYQDRNITVAEMLDSMRHTGYQATSVAEAVRIIDTMVTSYSNLGTSLLTNYQRSWPRTPSPSHPEIQSEIFLGYTSNLVSSGLRSTIRYLVEHKHVTCLVATAGGIEEDIIKCLGPTYSTPSFSANDAQLRSDHINRIGNLLVPNNNYVSFEDWITPLLWKMLEEQEASFAHLQHLHAQRQSQPPPPKGARAKAGAHVDTDDENPLIFSPSTFIARLGAEINDDSSICTWAYRNKIPIFCPALTDGSIGDMLAQFMIRARNRVPVSPSPVPSLHPWFSTSPLLLDIARDIDLLNSKTRHCQLHGAKMGAIILGEEW
ncbi:uncharacterized protein KY384_000188 [Bacidia gigantensis]|uniref:uncharacterized protein n=1 Tax=Bacidia gigantensis TaxID=2732470 RepID=UPI001D0409C0|nr:uncharacterized protein KY384_000188 [Bacidia gigantensis]KAG8526195.1 hypothetical protein KY384_000188 [Bacidia gigantensis]